MRSPDYGMRAVDVMASIWYFVGAAFGVWLAWSFPHDLVLFAAGVLLALAMAVGGVIFVCGVADTWRRSIW